MFLFSELNNDQEHVYNVLVMIDVKRLEGGSGPKCYADFKNPSLNCHKFGNFGGQNLVFAMTVSIVCAV